MKVMKNKKVNINVFSNRVKVVRGFCICLMLVYGFHDGLAQSNYVTTVTMKPSNSGKELQENKRIEEEKAIEFTIDGIKNENDVWTIEELLTSQKGIDRARIGSDNGYCLVITLKGSGIGEDFITSLLDSKEFGVKNYSERWIAKRFDKPGEPVFIQDSPAQPDNRNVTEDKNQEKDNN